jgi:hypothetical protein
VHLIKIELNVIPVIAILIAKVNNVLVIQQEQKSVSKIPAAKPVSK